MSEGECREIVAMLVFYMTMQNYWYNMQTNRLKNCKSYHRSHLLVVYAKSR